MNFDLPTLISRVITMVIALTLHEYAHAWTASRFNDYTARNAGRLTLNPLSHLDPIGTLMFLHIKHMTGVSIFFLSGMEYLLIFLLGVSLLRESTGSSIDARGRVETPRPFVKLAYVSLAGSMFTWMYGIATGGDFSKSLWQLEKVIYVPIVFLLCNRGLRGPKDHAVLGKIVLVAAALRSILAIYVVHVTAERDPETGELLLEHATSHHDSMLFAFASLLLVLMVIERADKKALRRLLLIQPANADTLVYWPGYDGWAQPIPLLVMPICTHRPDRCHSSGPPLSPWQVSRPGEAAHRSTSDERVPP